MGDFHKDCLKYESIIPYANAYGANVLALAMGSGGSKKIKGEANCCLYFYVLKKHIRLI